MPELMCLYNIERFKTFEGGSFYFFYFGMNKTRVHDRGGEIVKKV